MEDNINYSGTLRLKNPKTLERWKQNGEFQKQLDKGFIFSEKCGRFKTKICTCTKCRQ